jgi:putative ABC transport system substrate-binding protein
MKARSSTLIMVPSPIINSHRHEIVSLAAKHRLPAIYAVNRYVISGGLMSYGPSIAALSHRGAYFADKILKGTKPADLPVEQPSKLHGFVAEPKRSHKKNK